MKAFAKYDADRDDQLSRREVAAFAKGEYKFRIPDETLDTICKLFIKGDAKGVDKKSFAKVKVLVGIAREAAIDAEKKTEEEERGKKVAAMREEVTEKAKASKELVAKFVEKVEEADKYISPLVAKSNMTSSEMVSSADAADKMIEECNACLKAVSEGIAAVSAISAPELKSFVTTEVNKLQISSKPVEARLTKCTSLLSKFRASVAKVSAAELDKLRNKGLNVIFHHQAVKKLTKDALFKAFGPSKDDKIKESDFKKFFKKCEKKEDDDDMEISPEDVARLFETWDSEDAGFLTKEKFMNVTRKFLKVSKPSVISEDVGIKSKPLRRLEEGEVLELIMGPIMEGSVEVQRMQVSAIKDSLTGWVTPVGNQGTVFLEDGGNTYKVVKDTLLSGEFKIGGENKSQDRKLKVGEICEVVEWETKEPVSGLMRMKVRVKSNGEVGWVTTVGNTGIKFMQMV
jgi:Ca2+-binding EF-hand superfamily protein